MTWDLKEKNKIRKAVCKGSRQKPYKSVLMMPGDSCLDLKLMVEKGYIGSQTKVFAVDRDGGAMLKIGSFLKKVGIKDHTVYCEELHKVEFPAGTKFDFVYLDTCGQLNEHVLNWLSKQVQLGVFEEGARVAVAFSQWFRAGAKLYEDLTGFIKQEKISLPRVINEGDEVSDYQSNTHKVMGAVLRDLFGDIQETFLYKNSAKGIPMHVFLFKGRTGNKGIGNVIKFLATCTPYAPELITPGVKAAAQRYALAKKPDLAPAPKKTRQSKLCRPSLHKEETPLSTNVLLRELQAAIRAMELRLTTNTKTIVSLNSKLSNYKWRLDVLEDKLKFQEKPVMMIKTVTEKNGIKEVEEIPYPWGDGPAPVSDEEVNMALSYFD